MLRCIIEKDGSQSNYDCEVVYDEGNGVLAFTHRTGVTKKFSYNRLNRLQVINESGKMVVDLKTATRLQLDPIAEATPDTIEAYRTSIEDDVQRIFDSLSEAHRCMFKILLMGHGYTMNGVRGSISNRYRIASREQFGPVKK